MFAETPAVVAVPALQPMTICPAISTWAVIPVVVAFPTLQLSDCGKVADTPAVVAVPALQVIVVALDMPAVTPAVVAVPTLHEIVIDVSSDIPAATPAAVALPALHAIVIDVSSDMPAVTPAVVAVPALHWTTTGREQAIPVGVAFPTLHAIFIGKAQATPAVLAPPGVHAMIVAEDIPAVMPAVVALPGAQVIVAPPLALGIHIIPSFFLNNCHGFLVIDLISVSSSATSYKAATYSCPLEDQTSYPVLVPNDKNELPVPSLIESVPLAT